MMATLGVEKESGKETSAQRGDRRGKLKIGESVNADTVGALSGEF